MNANDLALGRNHYTADSVTVTEFCGHLDPCARIDIRWNDGAHVYEIYDTKAEAIAHAVRLGFSPNRS